jgi:hypothetical protein
MTDATLPYARLLEVLGERVRSRNDRQATALCPAHDDRAASLSVGVGRMAGPWCTARPVHDGGSPGRFGTARDCLFSASGGIGVHTATPTPTGPRTPPAEGGACNQGAFRCAAAYVRVLILRELGRS